MLENDEEEVPLGPHLLASTLRFPLFLIVAKLFQFPEFFRIKIPVPQAFFSIFSKQYRYFSLSWALP